MWSANANTMRATTALPVDDTPGSLQVPETQCQTGPAESRRRNSGVVAWQIMKSAPNGAGIGAVPLPSSELFASNQKVSQRENRSSPRMTVQNGSELLVIIH